MKLKSGPGAPNPDKPAHVAGLADPAG